MWKLIPLVILLSLSACGDDGGGEPDGGGAGARDGGPRDGGGLVFSADGGGSADAGPNDNCEARAKLVYVVDDGNRFYSFDPATVTFRLLGTLSCPAGGSYPFSMSVDRNAIAWVLYNPSGELFRVDTANVSCTKASYTPTYSLKLFGMGFVSNSAGSNDETLFIAGGSTTGLSVSTLAKVNFGSPITTSEVGWVSGNPELTGTGDAKLWGFFPDDFAPRVSQIDKTNGDILQTFEARQLAGDPQAWAFAFWGGEFWIFLQRTVDSSTKVWKMNATTGAVTDMTPTETGLSIVGAGVSTCAPTVLQ